MGMSVYGTGTIFQRGRIWYYAYFDGSKTRMVSSKSPRKAEAIKLRERILKQKMAGSLPDLEAVKITCGELLDDVLRHVEENGKASTTKVWKLVIDANLKPFFGDLKAVKITTDMP